MYTKRTNQKWSRSSNVFSLQVQQRSPTQLKMLFHIMSWTIFQWVFVFYSFYICPHFSCCALSSSCSGDGVVTSALCLIKQLCLVLPLGGSGPADGDSGLHQQTEKVPVGHGWCLPDFVRVATYLCHMFLKTLSLILTQRESNSYVHRCSYESIVLH